MLKITCIDLYYGYTIHNNYICYKNIIYKNYSIINFCALESTRNSNAKNLTACCLEPKVKEKGKVHLK